MQQHGVDRKIIMGVAALLLVGTTSLVVLFQDQRKPEKADTNFELPADLAGAYAENADNYEFPALQEADFLSMAAMPSASPRRSTVLPSSPQPAISQPLRGMRHEHTFTTGLVPPPPPTEMSIDESVPMPIPPSMNVMDPIPQPSGSLLDNMTLTAVIDKKAFFKINPLYRRRHRLPAVVSLAPGDDFESLNVVSIDGHDVTVSDGHKRSVRTLASVR